MRSRPRPGGSGELRRSRSDPRPGGEEASTSQRPRVVRPHVVPDQVPQASHDAGPSWRDYGSQIPRVIPSSTGPSPVMPPFQPPPFQGSPPFGPPPSLEQQGLG